MADTTSTATPPAESPSAAARTGGEVSPTRLAEDTSQGKTTIASSVVQKVAGIAAREISGVHALGGGLSRAFGGIRERIPGSTGASQASGVAVEVGEKQAAVDLDLIVEYGASIVDLAKAVRRNVIGAVEQMTGLEVIEVNIAVNDIHIASDNGGDAAVHVARVE
ncbi:MAG: Asp23/Gls24 family envelope stress response protein [Pseudonocardiaceae bacterium]